MRPEYAVGWFVVLVMMAITAYFIFKPKTYTGNNNTTKGYNEEGTSRNNAKKGNTPSTGNGTIVRDNSNDTNNTGNTNSTGNIPDDPIEDPGAPNTPNVDPIMDCLMSEWSEWTTCDKSCGGGSQVRTREILQEPTVSGGIQCGPTSESRDCNTDPCPIDCEVSGWSNWTNCDEPCGPGKQFRSRTVITPAQHGGENCPILTEEQDCNLGPCPVDCVMGEWNNWSECPVDCGGGVQYRTRDIVQMPMYGGASCEPASETRNCNTDPCPIDCVMSDWSNWTSCNKSCGGGTQSRSRNIILQSANGGTPCGPTSETRSCNTQGCPVNCVMGSWGAWSDCSADCGGGTQTRTRPIVTAARNGGTPCGNTRETRACNESACSPEGYELTHTNRRYTANPINTYTDTTLDECANYCNFWAGVEMYGSNLKCKGFSYGKNPWSEAPVCYTHDRTSSVTGPYDFSTYEKLPTR